MYLALYRKYRPLRFEDVLSQPHITETLKNEIQTGRTAHAYLFTGPRGTGKTTCSKILAMAVNCESPVGGDPCFACESCKAIESGATMDIVEIDAASNSGVDNIRDLREEANFLPGSCKYRVYIIDEAHMLSTGAFNALLKIMEEPPEHVKFILATTEAHKIPATILSRCQRFDFRRIQTGDIKARLLEIAAAEQFQLEDSAAALLARLADGGLRDALSLLDHCAGFSSEITMDSVVRTMGLVDRDYLFRLTDCVLQHDAGEAIREIDRLYGMSKDIQALLEELLGHFRNLMLLQTLSDPGDLLTVLPDEQARLREYAKKLTLPVVLSSMAELQSAIDRMGRNFDRRMTMELCMVKLCTPAMSSSPEALAARLFKLEAPISPAFAPPMQSPQPELPPMPPPQPELPPELSAPPSPAIPAAKADTGVTPMAEWGDVLQELMQSCPPLCGVLQGSHAFVGDGFLYVDSTGTLAGKMLKQEGNAARLLDAVEKKTGVRYKIRVKSAPAAPQEDKLSALLSKARDSGVEIRTE